MCLMSCLEFPLRSVLLFVVQMNRQQFLGSSCYDGDLVDRYGSTSAIHSKCRTSNRVTQNALQLKYKTRVDD